MNTGGSSTMPRSPKPWRLREPDAKDCAMLGVLYEGRILTAPQLQRVYGLESVGSLHPRLLGLLGPDGTPRVIERAKAPDGRYWYAVGPEGYSYLNGDLPRHKPLSRLRLSAQFTDHTHAVGWLMLTWLLARGGAFPPESTCTWWGERRAMLPYPLRHPKGSHSHGRVEADGVLVLTLPDGQHWYGALEHDQGTEDASDWVDKLGRWAAAIRAGSWQDRYGDTSPHLLVTVPNAARRAQLAPWLAAERAKHQEFYIWIAAHPAVSLGDIDPLARAAECVSASAWQQINADPKNALLPDTWSLPEIIAATAPWRATIGSSPGASSAPPTPRFILPTFASEVARLHTEIIAQEAEVTQLAHELQQLGGERDVSQQILTSTQVDLRLLTTRYEQTLTAYLALRAAQPTARLHRFCTPQQAWILPFRLLLIWVALLAADSLLLIAWILSNHLWTVTSGWDTTFGTLVGRDAPDGALLVYLARVPWCGGLLFGTSLLATFMMMQWARRLRI